MASHPSPGPESRYFGDREIDPAEKTPLVQGVFRSVASRYDLMNDLMSAGIHRLWKRDFVAQVAPRANERILDVAGGTGDIAFRLHEQAPEADVLVVDLTEDMVRVGRDRALDRGRLTGIGWSVGNAECLPVPDRSMDAVTIAFGLRNVANIDRALAEFRRVLRPGGRFFCLEFSRIAVAPLAALYERYSNTVLPRLGQLVAGDGDSYRYLVESIRRFPDQRALAGRLAAAGLANGRHRNLSGGIAAVHSAWRV
jgi:demethylmenaquinone methyltransferase/2-methoxy-6-polyprenyl-1,4-benzoquinol methylase